MTRKVYSEDFKREVAEASLEDGVTLKSTGEKYGVNPTLVRNWRIKYGGGIDESKSDSEWIDVDQIKLIEFFITGESPDEEKGDWGDSFMVINYAIPALSIVQYDDEVYVINGQVIDDYDEYLTVLESNAKEKVLIDGDPVSGEFLEGMIQSAEYESNDQEDVYERLEDIGADLEFFDDVDDIDESWGHCFGVRVWAADLESVSIRIDNGVVEEKIEDEEYEDVMDFIQISEEEGALDKKIALVDVSVV